MRACTALSVAVLGAVGIWTTPVVAGLGKQCWSNYDCPAGASCVAGDSEKSVQRCVAGTACSGAMMGNCPGDDASGQLACIWRPAEAACSKAPGGCKEIDGQLGIYKCLSMSRCDQYFDGSCSKQCNVNDQQCNGRGNCQLVSGSATAPTFACTCDNGWNGTHCDNVADDTCMTDVGQCGDHGTCKDGKCTCKDGYTGTQCEKAPPLSLSSSGSGENRNGVVTTPKSASTTITSSSKDSSTTSKKKSKSNKTLPAIIGIIAAVVLLATAAFVFYARKKRQQEAEADAFQSAGSMEELPIGPPTPKQRIVTM